MILVGVTDFFKGFQLILLGKIDQKRFKNIFFKNKIAFGRLCSQNRACGVQFSHLSAPTNFHNLLAWMQQVSSRCPCKIHNQLRAAKQTHPCCTRFGIFRAAGAKFFGIFAKKRDFRKYFWSLTRGVVSSKFSNKGVVARNRSD